MIPAWWATRRFTRADDALAGEPGTDEREVAARDAPAPSQALTA